MHCLASSASAVCAVEKPTRLRAPVTFPGRLCILRFGFHQKETFYSVRLAECFSAGVSQRTNGKLPVWTVWCECARTFPSPTRSWLTLKLLKANPGAKLGWCVRKWANPTGPGVGGDSKTGFLSRDVSSSSIGGFPAELSGSRLPHLQCPADLSIPLSICQGLPMSPPETPHSSGCFSVSCGGFQSLQTGFLMDTSIVGGVNRDLTNHTLLRGDRKPVSV